MCKTCQENIAHHPAPVREWRVRYHEPGYLRSVFQMWFTTKARAEAFAARHSTPFHPAKVDHIPYGGH